MSHHLQKKLPTGTLKRSLAIKERKLAKLEEEIEKLENEIAYNSSLFEVGDLVRYRRNDRIRKGKIIAIRYHAKDDYYLRVRPNDCAICHTVNKNSIVS